MTADAAIRVTIGLSFFEFSPRMIWVLRGGNGQIHSSRADCMKDAVHLRLLLNIRIMRSSAWTK